MGLTSVSLLETVSASSRWHVRQLREENTKPQYIHLYTKTVWQALPEPLASKNVWKFIFPKGEYADGMFTGGLRGGMRCSQVAECSNGRTKVCLRHPDLPQHICQFHLSQCSLPWGTIRRLRGCSLLPSTPDIPKLLPLYLHHPLLLPTWPASERTPLICIALCSSYLSGCYSPSLVTL